MYIRKNKTSKNKTTKNKTYNKKIFSKLKGGKTKKRIGIRIESRGLFTNEQDCLMKLRKPSNKGGKCSLIGYGSYELKKEIPIYK